MANENKWQDSLAYILLFAGVFVLMAAIGLFSYRSFFMRPPSNRVEIVVTDRLPDVTRQGKESTLIRIDSLINLVQKHEKSLEKRETFDIEKAEWDKDYQDIVVLLGVFIIGIAAFFGYRSLKDIKEECRDIVKNEVSNYLKKNLRGMMRDEMKGIYKDEGYRTIVARLEKELISGKQFITAQILKSSVVEILEGWMINTPEKKEENPTPSGNPDDFDD